MGLKVLQIDVKCFMQHRVKLAEKRLHTQLGIALHTEMAMELLEFVY